MNVRVLIGGRHDPVLAASGLINAARARVGDGSPVEDLGWAD